MSSQIKKIAFGSNLRVLKTESKFQLNLKNCLEKINNLLTSPLLDEKYLLELMIQLFDFKAFLNSKLDYFLYV